MQARMLIIYMALLMVSGISNASPKQDLEKFRDYYSKKFPNVAFSDYKDGIYALSKPRREIWQSMEEFIPAYTDAVDLGKTLFETKFKNSKSYASCFKNGGIAIRQHYPYFDSNTQQIKTIEEDINQCRKLNGEKPLKYKKGHLAAISAYMAYTSRGKKIRTSISAEPKAQAIYKQGKTFFYAKRGQLNFSCADCHMYYAGRNARSDLLSPALGQVTHFPVWRLKWDAKGGSGPTSGLGTLHRRYAGCNKNIRAKPFKAQGKEYKALEYFHTYMSKDLELNGPAIRP